MIKNTLIILAFITGFSGLALSLYSRNKTLVFIEMGKVYEEFQLTTELDKDLEKAMQARKSVTDSLYEDLRKRTLELKSRPARKDSEIEQLARLEQEYLYKKDLFEKENQSVSAQHNSKIWDRLNQYVHDYGELHHLTIILGANGQGNIMYGENSRNITGEVIAYVNTRYNNK